MIPEMSATELAAALRSAAPPHLLDVREPEEFELAALAGARLIPLGQLAGGWGEIGNWRGEAVVVYCHHGIRSLHAAAWLREAGFTDVTNLAGGIDAWSREVDRSLPRY